MKYENAYKGVKLLFWSEIIFIVCAILTFVAATSAIAVKETAEGNASLYSVFMLIAAIIGVTAGLIGIFGYYEAAKDEKYFFYSLFFVMASVILSVVASFITDGSRVRRVLELLTTLFEELTLIYAIYAIVQLAKKTENKSVAKFGNFLLNLIFVILMLAIISDVVIVLTKNNTTVASVLGTVDAALSVFAYVMYLIYLVKAKKMLA